MSGGSSGYACSLGGVGIPGSLLGTGPGRTGGAGLAGLLRASLLL